MKNCVFGFLAVLVILSLTACSSLDIEKDGGLRVTLSFPTESFLRNFSSDPNSEILADCMIRTRDYNNGTFKDYFAAFGKAFEDLFPGNKMAPLFINKENNKISTSMTNEEVLAVLAKEKEIAENEFVELLSERLSQIGYSDANIIPFFSKDKFIVELPGNFEQNNLLIFKNVTLEFWKTFDNKEVYQYLMEANEKIARMDLEQSNSVIDEESQEIVPDTIETNDKPELLKVLDSKGSESNFDPDSSIAALQRNYPIFSKLAPMVDNNTFQLLSGSVVGTCHVEDTATINHYLNLTEISTLFPQGMVFKWAFKVLENAPNFIQLYVLKYSMPAGPALDGDIITWVGSSNNEVEIKMNSVGANIWSQITKDASQNSSNINDHKQIAIVINDRIVTCPTVISEIKDGSSVISGDFTAEEANNIAFLLKAPRLNFPPHIIDIEVVYPK